MTSRIVRWRIGFARLDYVRQVHWAAHSEGHGDAIVLEIETSDGVRGAAEAIMRPKWHEVDREAIEAQLTQAILPALVGIEINDAQALASVLDPALYQGFPRALADQALHDARAQLAGVPLWRHLGGQGARVQVSFTLTRTQPAIMAQEAEAMRAKFGFTAFKVKTGQGMEIDRQAIAAIRSAVGADALIMADSNRAHSPGDVAAMSHMLAQSGIVWFEDPCVFDADESFVAVQASSDLPVLVDNRCRSFAAAQAFVDLGARGLSVKTMKTGHTETLAIAQLAQEKNRKVAVGISASGGAGAMHSLSLAAALPSECVCLPCEESFFLYLQRDLVSTPLEIEGGFVDLAEHGAIAPLIDWRMMEEVVRA